MSKPLVFDFSLTTGTNPPIRFYVFDETGKPVSLVGAKIWLTLRDSDREGTIALLVNSDDDAALFDLSNGINGYYDYTFTTAQTGLLTADTYFWTHKIKLASGRYEYPSEGTIFVQQGSIDLS